MTGNYFAVNTQDQEATCHDESGHAVLYRPGDTVDGYVLTGLLGAGGMAVIYKVRHPLLGKDFAMKILPPNLIDEGKWRRFQAEGRALARLNHGNIVTIHNMGVSQSCPYIVMDWLPGITLADRLNGQALPLARSEVVSIFLQIASGLYSAHQCGVIHRDVKPSNIMLVPTVGGSYMVKIVDFGLARLSSYQESSQQATAQGEIVGSPLYMSPEQCIGRAIDLRTDIYSLGCTLFEALTGRPPFIGETALHTAMLHQMQAAPSLASARPDIVYPEALEAILACMLSKSAEERFQSMKDFAYMLAPLGDQEASLRKLFPEAPLGLEQAIKELGGASLAGSSAVNLRAAHVELEARPISGASKDEPSGDVKKSTAALPASGTAIGLGLTALSCLVIVLGLLNWRAGNVPASGVGTAPRAAHIKIAGPLSSAGCSVLVSDQIPVETLARIKPILVGYGPGRKGRRMMYLRNPGFLSGITIEGGSGTLVSGAQVALPESAPVVLRVGYTVADNPQVIDKAGPDVITELRLDGSEVDPLIFLRRTVNWRRLQRITFSRYELKEGYFKGLSAMHRPWVLTLRSDALCGASFREIDLPALKCLQELCFCSEKVKPENLLGLEKASNLESVGFSDAEIAPGVLSKLASLKNLRELNLQFSPPSKKDGANICGFQPELKESVLAELKLLHHLNVLYMSEPKWSRPEIVRLLHEVPAARLNSWAGKYL